MNMNFETFFDIYLRPNGRDVLQRDGIEFKYAAASLMIACSKADMDEDPREREAVTQILQDAFDITEHTIERLLTFADSASAEEYLSVITRLVNEQFSDSDKRFILEKLWMVAHADGHIHDREVDFMHRLAADINMTEVDVDTARKLASHALNSV